jgi:hypothetical protein
LKHHIRLQRPEELRMMVCEVLLNRIEELRVGAACQLRPALAVGDPMVPFDDRFTVAAIRLSLTRPAEVV